MPNLTIPSRSRIRTTTNNVMLRTYWGTEGEALHEINEALQQHNVFIDFEGVSFKGNEGRVSLSIRANKNFKTDCGACTEDNIHPRFDNCLSYSWREISSGKFEVVAYIS